MNNRPMNKRLARQVRALARRRKDVEYWDNKPISDAVRKSGIAKYEVQQLEAKLKGQGISV